MASFKPRLASLICGKPACSWKIEWTGSPWFSPQQTAGRDVISILPAIVSAAASISPIVLDPVIKKRASSLSMAYLIATVSIGCRWISSIIANFPRLLINPLGSRLAQSSRSRSSSVAYGSAGYRCLSKVVFPERLGPIIKQLLCSGIFNHLANIIRN